MGRLLSRCGLLTPEPSGREERLTLWTPPRPFAARPLHPPSPQERPGRLSSMLHHGHARKQSSKPPVNSLLRASLATASARNLVFDGGPDDAREAIDIFHVRWQQLRSSRQVFLLRLPGNDDDFAPDAGRQSARFRVADLFMPSVRERVEQDCRS